jgi:hypothetical protein
VVHAAKRTNGAYFIPLIWDYFVVGSGLREKGVSGVISKTARSYIGNKRRYTSNVSTAEKY